MYNNKIEELKYLLGQVLDEKDVDNFIFDLKNVDKDDFSKLLDSLAGKMVEIPSVVFELRYQSNMDRTFKQVMESRFYFIYLLTKKKNRNLKTAITNVRGYRSIKIHDLFDVGYYLRNNPDVRESGDDPLMHYIYYGFKEGRNPNTHFDGFLYLESNTDVKETNLNPLIHYSLYGMKKGGSTTNKTH